MNRRPLFLLTGLVLSSTALAMPDPTVLAKECYVKVLPALKASGGELTPEVRSAYLAWAENAVLADLAEEKKAVLETVLDEVRRDPTLRDAVFGSVFPPDPSILQNYARFRSELGPQFVQKYESLVIAMSVAKRVKGVDKGSGANDIGRDYQPDFWRDESLRLPGSDSERTFISRIADFMTASHVSAANLFSDAALQGRLKVYLKTWNVPSNLIAEVQKTAPFGERLKNAMILLRQRPAARDPKPTTTAWLRHLVAQAEAKPTSTPVLDGKPMPWPLFPIETAPWPLLMPLAHPVPLSEATYIWEAFQGVHGPDRYHTYGPYRGDDDLMPDSLRPSKWFWDAWPDRIIHGGMCVPISKGTVDLYSALGKPAMWAGQPGHANLISFQHVGGKWTAEIEQDYAGGPTVTFAQWYFDEVGHGIRFRDLYLWTGAEHHLGLALGMNLGLRSAMDTRLAASLFRLMPVQDRPTLGVKLLKGQLAANPFNAEIWYLLAENTFDTSDAVALGKAALNGDPSLLLGQPSSSATAFRTKDQASDQYWSTLTLYSTHYSLLSHAAPKEEAEMRLAHEHLKTVPGITSDEMMAFAERWPSNAKPEAILFDRKLAEGGDTFGLFRMGQRYRDGDGVPADMAKAKDLFARAAAKGDSAAAVLLGRLTPMLPLDVSAVKASSVFGNEQIAAHLVDGSGMVGPIHDNNAWARTMWQTGKSPAPTAPANGLLPSPAWVRFDFPRPTKFDSILVWNHNQITLTDRGFRKTRIYGTSDGLTWIPVTTSEVIELPQASGLPSILPTTIPNRAANRAFTSVIIAAEMADGNYGSDYYGLSAVRFCLPPLVNVVPEKLIAVTVPSIYEWKQAASHLVDGAGMAGATHDNDEYARTMWLTSVNPPANPPVTGLPASPGWARFDFTKPQLLSEILIWNYNQLNYTQRGFRKVRIYGTTDGVSWTPLTGTASIELPRAAGMPMAEPITIALAASTRRFQSVIIAAEAVDGNYGGDSYGLSAVRFVHP